MKVKAVRGVSWSTYTLYGVEAEPKVIDTTEQKTADGKPLPKEVVDLFLSSGCWVKCDDDGNPVE